MFLLILTHGVQASGDAQGGPDPSHEAWQFELGGAALREAWDYNLSDEDLGAATYAWLRHVKGPWWLGGEGLIIGVHQERVPNAIVAGGSALIRWQRRRRALVYFGNIGGGYSYASGVVPQRGTRANYIAQSGGGLMVPVARDVMLVVELMWLHLSNNSLAGRARNPDIQSIGLRFGIAAPALR